MLKLPLSSLGRPTLTAALAGSLCESSAALAAAGAHAAPDVLRDSVARVLGPLSGELRGVEKRGPGADEECAVCFERLCSEAVVHCGFGCGRAVHAECFRRYVEATSGPPRCILCRTGWEAPKGRYGKKGFLVGRRLVDLSEYVPEAFAEPVIVARRATGSKGNGKRGGSSLRSGSNLESGSSGIVKVKRGRTTENSMKAGKILEDGGGVRFTRSSARLSRQV